MGLQQKGENPDLKNKNGSPLICIGAEQGNVEVVKLLLRANAVLNSLDAKHNTPLALAVRNGKQEMVEFLLNQKGIDKESVCAENKMSPLLLSVYYNHEQIAEALLEYGVNYEARDEDGNTAFLIAIKNTNPTLVKKLLDWGVDSTVKNHNNETAKDIANKKMNYEILDILNNG